MVAFLPFFTAEEIVVVDGGGGKELMSADSVRISKDTAMQRHTTHEVDMFK